jgi:hypothetical protein
VTPRRCAHGDLDGELRSRLARLARAGSEPESSRNGSIPTAYWKPCKCVRPKKPRFARLLQSPLTDSNRRPPPYHEALTATEGNAWQRLWLVSAGFGGRAFAVDCPWLRLLGSINAPSFRLRARARSYARPHGVRWITWERVSRGVPEEDALLLAEEVRHEAELSDVARKSRWTAPALHAAGPSLTPVASMTSVRRGV